MRIAQNFGDVIDPAAPSGDVVLIDLAGPEGPRECSRGELLTQVRGISRGLAKRGLSRGDRIGLIAGNSIEYLSVCLGAMCAGLIVVPVNYKLPSDTIDWIFRDCTPTLVFVDSERAHLCPSDFASVKLDPGLKDILDPGHHEPVLPDPGDVSTILYTSGSTGRPKGVELTHGGCLWSFRSEENADWTRPDERFLIAAPFYHMNGLFTAIYTLMSNSSAVLLWPFSAPAYIGAISRYRCTSLAVVPTMMALVLREYELLEKDRLDCVKNIYIGSAPLTRSLFDKTKRAFPKAVVLNGYGSTEAGYSIFGSHPEGKPWPDLSVGHPLPGVFTRLIGPENEGVMEIMCPSVLVRYHNQPNETANRIKDGWFNTGDIMCRDEDGFFYYVGRSDDMFVCGGENIYPSAVENLLTQHPAIQQACVVSAPDDVKGDVPIAFVVPHRGMQVEPSEVINYMLAKGPVYAHPRHIEVLRELPLAGTGKVDRHFLRGRARALWS